MLHPISVRLRPRLLASACGAVLALCATGAALADTVSFAYTGAQQSFTVPAGVTLVKITAAGAQGGIVTGNGGPFAGGLGATMSGEFSVTPGSVLQVVVGGQGNPSMYTSGGGGGSGVATGGGGVTATARPGSGAWAWAGRSLSTGSAVATGRSARRQNGLRVGAGGGSDGRGAAKMARPNASRTPAPPPPKAPSSASVLRLMPLLSSGGMAGLMTRALVVSMPPSSPVSRARLRKAS